MARNNTQVRRRVRDDMLPDVQTVQEQSRQRPV